MREVLLSIAFVSLSLCCFAGSKKITKDDIAFLSDRTEPIEYNSYAVTIQLSQPVEFNITGTVYCGEQSKSVIIEAGKRSKNIYFDNLSNQRRYDIIVKLNDYTSFPKANK